MIKINEGQTRNQSSKIIIPINMFSSIEYKDSTGILTIFFIDGMLTKTIKEDSLSISYEDGIINVEYQLTFE